MAVRKAAYQYETSPKKLEPEYKENKNDNRIQEKEVVKKKKTKPNKFEEFKRKFKICSYIFVVFSIFLAISYRNTLISQNFAQIQALKKEAKNIQKDNEQLEMGIQNSLNLTNIEEAAKLLGMQRLTNSQKVYITLDKKDYVEPSGEAIIIDDGNWFTKIIDKIKSFF